MTLNGTRLTLTPKEYRLLQVLAQHAGNVVTHQHLLKEVWGSIHVHDTHYLRIFVRKLRQKIEPEPNSPRILVTELGVGYRLAQSDGETPGTWPGRQAAQKRVKAGLCGAGAGLQMPVFLTDRARRRHKPAARAVWARVLFRARSKPLKTQHNPTERSRSGILRDWKRTQGQKRCSQSSKPAGSSTASWLKM